MTIGSRLNSFAMTEVKNLLGPHSFLRGISAFQAAFRLCALQKAPSGGSVLTQP
jgi:hypothetical protein